MASGAGRLPLLWSALRPGTREPAQEAGQLARGAERGATVDDDDVKNLLWLRDLLGDGCREAVVVTTGPRAYRRADGIAVIWAALLGP
jgi:hypothetical protein